MVSKWFVKKDRYGICKGFVFHGRFCADNSTYWKTYLQKEEPNSGRWIDNTIVNKTNTYNMPGTQFISEGENVYCKKLCVSSNEKQPKEMIKTPKSRINVVFFSIK